MQHLGKLERVVLFEKRLIEVQWLLLKTPFVTKTTLKGVESTTRVREVDGVLKAAPRPLATLPYLVS